MKRQQVHVAVVSKASPAALYGLLKDGRTWGDWSDLDECVPEGLAANGEEHVGTVRASRRGRTRGWDRITELVPDQRLATSTSRVCRSSTTRPQSRWPRRRTV